MDKQILANLQNNLNTLLAALIKAKQFGDTSFVGSVDTQIVILEKMIKLWNKLIEEHKPKPWDEIGISRSTWYRDQQRAKANDTKYQQKLNGLTNYSDNDPTIEEE